MSGLLRNLPLLLLVAASGCPASSAEVRPPSDQFYYPTGMDVTPDQGVLFVANANSDLRYDSGTIIPVDLDKTDALITDWLATGEVPSADCDIDLLAPYTLVCDERKVVIDGASVRVGNFATDLKIQTLQDPGTLRVFAAVRGDPSLTWVDWDVGARDLACGEQADYPECDDAHRLTQLRNDSELHTIPDEPFGLYVDSKNAYAMITHLTSGAVTLAEAPIGGGDPVLADALGNLFAPDPLTGVRGAVGAAGRLPGSDNDRVYVTSRSESRVQTLLVERPPGGYPQLVTGEHFFMNLVLPSNDGRGIAFSADGNRAYIVNRNPPMLHIIDTSLDQYGVPKNVLQAGVEICPQASNLVVTDSGRGERIYVACFHNGQIWSVDPKSETVEAIIDVGRGPDALVASAARGRLYVSNFLEDTIAVIDLTPESVTENRVVLRLGHPRQQGGDQ